MKIPIHENVQTKLDSFYESKKIPHIIFHGSSGTGKRTIVHEFLNKIYNSDKQKMKSNIMYVNCAHGKGIKFIRDELKFFAKTNIQFNKGVMFKTIVLLNADYLTIDAQSALRRCIELFSINTRFFIIVENKHKLLNPILSRFCEIYIPEYTDENNQILNLHQYNLKSKYLLENMKNTRKNELYEKMSDLEINIPDHIHLVKRSTELYEEGYSCLDVIQWINESSGFSPSEKSEISMCFYKIKSEYRCEKLLMLYMLDYAYLRLNKDLKNVGFI